MAVHGLGGDWESTWTEPKSNRLWLRDFIPAQFTNTKLRIWSFGYDSATAFTNSVADIDDAAKALINALDGERQQKNSRKKPIVFIAHSLGGIIVKRVCYNKSNLEILEILTNRNIQAINLALERSELWNDIVDSVFSIMFFAVPHCGADTAKLATVAANVSRFATFGFAVNKNFIEALNRNSREFRQISDAFIQPASKVQIIRTFYETNKMANKLVSFFSEPIYPIRSCKLTSTDGTRRLLTGAQRFWDCTMNKPLQSKARTTVTFASFLLMKAKSTNLWQTQCGI